MPSLYLSRIRLNETCYTPEVIWVQMVLGAAQLHAGLVLVAARATCSVGDCQEARGPNATGGGSLAYLLSSVTSVMLPLVSPGFWHWFLSRWRREEVIEVVVPPTNAGKGEGRGPQIPRELRVQGGGKTSGYSSDRSEAPTELIAESVRSVQQSTEVFAGAGSPLSQSQGISKEPLAQYRLGSQVRTLRPHCVPTSSSCDGGRNPTDVT